MDDERMASSRSAPPYKHPQIEIRFAPDLPIKLYRSWNKIFFHRTISRTPVANGSFNEQSTMRMRTHSRTGLGGV